MSKGLEALKWLVDNKLIKYENGWQEAPVILESINDIEKELKALEILKSACIENWKIRISASYKDYIDEYANSCVEYISEEEYELLKEVLL